MKKLKYLTEFHVMNNEAVKKEVEKLQKNLISIEEIQYNRRMREQGYSLEQMKEEIEHMRKSPNPNLYEPYATLQKQFIKNGKQ